MYIRIGKPRYDYSILSTRDDDGNNNNNNVIVTPTYRRDRSP